MVALAPITNETLAWDVFDTFPKLHSRAREAKTSTCTEAPRFKSRSGIEIWLVIYDRCDRLESFTRDPIGFVGSRWNLNEFVGSRVLVALDPSGLHVAVWMRPSRTSAAGYPWSDTPPGDGTLGGTKMTKLSITCFCWPCKQCVPKQKYIDSCHIESDFSISIDVPKARQEPPPNPTPPGWSEPEWTYGHEQRHVQNMLDELKRIAGDLKSTPQSCMDPQTCELQAQVVALKATLRAEIYWQDEMAHKHPPFNVPGGTSAGFPPMPPMPPPTR